MSYNRADKIIGGRDAKMTDVLALYRGTTLGTRTIVKGRTLLSNLEFVEQRVPKSGTIVDLGCGHGLFSNLMALSSPDRQVIGIDLSPEKIKWARSTVGSRNNIQFLCGDFLNMDLPPCDIITIVDVMYLLSADLQRNMLAFCRQNLKKEGLLVWKAQERRPRWKFAWTYFQELLGTAAGMTIGKQGRMCFMSRGEALGSLRGVGFEAEVVEMQTRLPYTDILYVGKLQLSD